MDNIGSVGRAGQAVRQLQKAGEFLFVVNLQVSNFSIKSLFFQTRVARCNVVGGGVLS